MAELRYGRDLISSVRSRILVPPQMLDSRPWYQLLSQPLGRLRERFLGWYQFLSQL